jgi:hypothetical protein
MNIKLDNDQWQAANSTTLGEILADLSERAHAKLRIVTTVTLDRRRITDRDIDPTLLQESIVSLSRRRPRNKPFSSPHEGPLTGSENSSSRKAPR